eukprot:CAMPEP_0185279422 /NCGR_PEP_ID=MMETSP1359-20130426/63519_1 /TAXON_ID=552665 /ORGANISM="Bigelowiella longifila, Strain CCMP242" /LENGTH=174 /DNA_ID=CAMNT_0027874299 /DNA_START=63 /DNA_END=587 /DNA_ORIENTATION=-
MTEEQKSANEEIVKKCAEFNAGCYMTFSPASWGALFYQWSAKPTEFKEEIFAYFEPGKKVPAFKYKKHGGKSEIIREIQAGKDKRLYIGFTHYIKAAIENKGKIVLFYPDVACFYLTGGNVFAFELGKVYDFTEIKASCIAAIPAKAGTFEGVKTLSGATFKENANKVGASLGF